MKKRVKKELPLIIILVILNLVVLLLITFSVYNYLIDEEILMSPGYSDYGFAHFSFKCNDGIYSYDSRNDPEYKSLCYHVGFLNSFANHECSDRGGINFNDPAKIQFYDGCSPVSQPVFSNMCVDSDNGKDLYRKGTTSIGQLIYEDKCSGVSTLQESWCSNNNYIMEWKAIPCPNECDSANGVCKNVLNLVAYYQFDNDLLDYSGKNYNGKCDTNKCPLYINWELKGKSASFDGVDDFVYINDNLDLNFGTGDFTIAIWIKFPIYGSSSWEGIVSKGYTTSAPAGSFGLVRDGTKTNSIRFQTGNIDGKNFNVNLVSGVLSDGWHHIAITKQGRVNTLYVDGEVSGTPQDKDIADLKNTQKLLIGQANSRFFKGAIDELRIYKGKALSADEVKNLAADWDLNLKSIHAPEAWQIIKGNENTIIAIIDTGIGYKTSTVPSCDWDEMSPSFDFTKCVTPNALWKNTKEIPNNGIDDDSNGYIDDIVGWDFYGADACMSDGTCICNGVYPCPKDIISMETNNPSYNKNWAAGNDAAHGQALANIIRANKHHDDRAESYLQGICPNCKLMILRIDQGDYTEDDLSADEIARAYKYVADNGASIIISSQVGSRSTGTQSPFAQPVVEQAINYAYSRGALIIIAAGNEGSSGSDYPAKFDKVISVGSVTLDGKRAPWSNYGDVEISAPGEVYFSKPVVQVIGTSASAPYVAGAAGLVKSVNPSLTNEQIKQILISTADPITTDYPIGGRLNVYKAVLEAKKTLG